jgi:hypothetical protein
VWPPPAASTPPSCCRADPVERDLLTAALLAAQEYQRDWMTAMSRTLLHEYAKALKRG